MDKELVATSLQDCLNAYGDEKSIEDIIFSMSAYNLKKTDTTVDNLLSTLKSQASLDIFNGKMHVIGNSATRMEIEDLAAWLLRRGGKICTKNAVSDLDHYIEADEIPCHHTFALTGLKVNHDCKFSGGITLLSWEDLPDSYHKTTIHKLLASSLGHKLPTAALIQKKVFPKIHTSDNKYELPQLDESEIRDVILCIAASGPFSHETIVKWLDPPVWVPHMGVSSSIPNLGATNLNDNWSSEHCDLARELFTIFKDMNEKQKNELRLPIERLMMAMRRLSKVDSAIDLGIALEALFLNDVSDQGELTFRLKIRVARYMENDLEQRKKVFRLVGDLYILRSKAVHSGIVPNTFKSRKILHDGYSLAARAIRRIIKNGRPEDWSDVQLS